MKTKTTILSLIFIAFAITAFSQRYTLIGQVINQGGASLEYANVSLWKDSILIVGDVTNQMGEFSLSALAGTYELSVRFLGYEEWTKELDVTRHTEVDNITLVSESIEMNEVEVTHKTALIERQADRLVLNVDKSVLASGRFAIDILSISPGVWINGFGKISINGKMGTQVMIDGKLLKLSGVQLESYLRTLRSEEISKVEIIEVPGAEFDAEGTGGLINIVLKRKRIEGFNGRFYTGFEQGRFSHISAGIFTNYKKEKWTFFGNYYFIKEKSFSDFKERRDNKGNNFNFNSSIDQTMKVFNQQFRTGLNYEINSRQNLGVEVVGTFNDREDYAEAISQINTAAAPLTNVAGVYLSDFNNQFVNATFNYNNAIDTLGTHLKFLVDYTTNDHVASNHYTSDYEDVDNVFLQQLIYRNDVPNNVKIIASNLDFVRPLLSGETIGAGFKFSKSNIDTRLKVENLVNNEWVYDSQQSNVFDYEENVSAGYLNFSKNINKTSLKLGIRGEYSDIRGQSQTLNESFKNDYFNWFPSLFISHSLNEEKGNSTSFYYGRRLERPNFESLNPFRYRINDFTLTTGNSNLNPQYNHVLQWSLLWQNTYSISAFYSHTSDVIAQVLIPEGELSVYQEQNLDANISYGININIPIKLSSWWSTYNYASAYNNEYQFKSENYTNQRLTFSGRTSHQLSLKNDFLIELLASYISEQSFGNLFLESNFYVDIGCRKSMLNKKLNFSLKVTDVFQTKRNDRRATFNDTSIDLDISNQTRLLKIHLIYNFSLGTTFKRKRLESSNYDEKGRLNN